MRTIEERLQRLELFVNNSESIVTSPLSSIAHDVISYGVENRQETKSYIISVSEEIIRLLSTSLGSRVMRPEYGSELYKLRDRKLNTEWKLWAIKYTFEAINRYIERVRCRKVLFEIEGDGKVKMKLELEER